MSEAVGYSSSATLCCGTNHVFVYAGTPPIPDGWLCSCGLTQKVTCSRCRGSGLEPQALLRADPLTQAQIELGQRMAKARGEKETHDPR